MDVDDLLLLDRAHVWHPYASMPSEECPLLVTSAQGVRLQLASPVAGSFELVDGMSSWWAAIHGYGHPVLDRAVHDQVGRMSHVMFGGLTHAPAVALATSLVELTPKSLEHVFFSDSGSVAVEVAVKMAIQYWSSRAKPAKRRLLTWRGGYHGDTFQAMSVCDPDGGMHSLWGDTLHSQVFADAPPIGYNAAVDPLYVAQLTDLIAQNAEELAAVIVEPVVQGAGGMRFHNPHYLRVLREVTETHGVLLIFDEVATGFGRTGELFAADHARVSPDIMCVGKALTGGYLSLAATLCTSELAEGIAAGRNAPLMHGPTFMGNPLACAVANASISLLQAGQWRADVGRIESGLRTGLAPARGLPGVADVRTLGAIGVVELDHPVDVGAATRAALAHGVWLRPFRNLVYAMPPYTTDDGDVASIALAVLAATEVG